MVSVTASPDGVPPQCKLLFAGAVLFTDHKLQPTRASAARLLGTSWSLACSKLAVRKDLSGHLCVHMSTGETAVRLTGMQQIKWRREGGGRNAAKRSHQSFAQRSLECALPRHPQRRRCLC